MSAAYDYFDDTRDPAYVTALLADPEGFGTDNVSTLNPRPSRPVSPSKHDGGGQGTPGTAYLGLIRSGADLMRREFPPLAWHVPNVIPEGFTLLVGAPKAGKSWLALDIVCAASSGRTVFGEHLPRRPVLYLALEDGDRRLHDRIRQLAYTEHVVPFDYVTQMPPKVSAPDFIRGWIDSLPTVDAAPLVFVDTLGRIRGPRLSGESSYDADYRLGASLHAIAQDVRGCGVVAVHHDRKAGSVDFVDDVSGTNGLAGSADTIAVLRRDREATEGVLLVTGRDVDEASYGIEFDAGRWNLAGESWHEARTNAAKIAAASGRGDLASKAVHFITTNGAATPKQISDGIEESHDAVKKALQRMHGSGRIDRDQGSYFLPVQSGRET